MLARCCQVLLHEMEIYRKGRRPAPWVHDHRQEPIITKH